MQPESISTKGRWSWVSTTVDTGVRQWATGAQKKSGWGKTLERPGGVPRYRYPCPLLSSRAKEQPVCGKGGWGLCPQSPGSLYTDCENARQLCQGGEGNTGWACHSPWVILISNYRRTVETPNGLARCFTGPLVTILCHPFQPLLFSPSVGSEAPGIFQSASNLLAHCSWKRKPEGGRMGKAALQCSHSAHFYWSAPLWSGASSQTSLPCWYSLQLKLHRHREA